MEPIRGCSLGSTTSVRLTPSAPGGHCSASAVPISKTRMAHAAIVLCMTPFKPLGGGRWLLDLGGDVLALSPAYFGKHRRHREMGEGDQVRRHQGGLICGHSRN